MTVKKKANLNLQVTGRTTAYIQTVGKDGKLGKPQPVVVTSVVAGQVPSTATRVTRRKKRK